MTKKSWISVRKENDQSLKVAVKTERNQPRPSQAECTWI